MNDAEATHDSEPTRNSRYRQWAMAIVVLFVAYVISAGPIIAIGCRLRDATGWNGFYVVFLLYWPLVYPLGDIDFVEAYLTWWLKLFDARPPG